MSDVTRILNAIEQGDARAAGCALRIVSCGLRIWFVLRLSYFDGGREEARSFDLTIIAVWAWLVGLW